MENSEKRKLFLRIEFLENAIEDAIDRLLQGKTSVREALLQEIPEDDEIFVLRDYLHRAEKKLWQATQQNQEARR
jgi:hypothetical protein